MIFCSFAYCFRQRTERMDKDKKIEIFQILGISQTKDEQLIKNAYREKLADVNPEDDPEGFKRLRGAYEQACRLARQEETALEEDDTPSGRWVKKAAAIYQNMNTRRDAASWESLFEEDCFVSLEDEESCRRKLFQFLMEHFRLPTHVWKLLDRHLSVTENPEALREAFPGDFIRFVVSKCSRGEEVDFDQFQGAPDAPYDLFLQYYDRCLQAFQEKDLDKAGESIRLADELDIRHPVMEICRAELLARQGNPEEALGLLEELHQAYPEDDMICYSLAENLWKRDKGANQADKDRAAALFKKLKAEDNAHYMANLRLMEWYFDRGQFHQAKECGEQILAVGGDAAFMELLRKVNARIEKELEAKYEETGDSEAALELCWCYLQDGKAAKGIFLAERLKDRVSSEKREEYSGLMAKLYMEEAQYEQAVEMADLWQRKLEERLAAGGPETEKDKDRVRQAHLIRMQCFRCLGFCGRQWFVEAVRECESLLAHSPRDVGVLLQMAQIYVEMQEYEKALAVTERLINDYQVYAAYFVSLEACHRQLFAVGVVTNALKCIQHFPGYGKAYEYLAKVYLDLKRPEDAQRVLSDAEKNGVKSVLLDAYRYQLENKPPQEDMGEMNQKLKQFRREYLQPVERGELSVFEKGLALLNQYLYCFPDSYLLVERGVYYKAAHRYEQAREDFEKALSISPANPYALNGLSQVYKYAGDYEKALVSVRKAILYGNQETAPYCYIGMARLYCLMGQYEKAILVCRQYEKLPKREAPGPWFADLLADCYVNLGRAQEACQVYGTFQKLPRYENCRKKVFSLARCGQGEQARAAMGEWKKAMEAARGRGWKSIFTRLYLDGWKVVCLDHCMYHNMAGWVELLTGSRQEALKEFRRSLTLFVNEDSALFPLWILRDAVFVFALLSEKKLGVRWAKWLRLKTPERFYGQEKERLAYELFGDFFLEDTAKLEERLERGTACYVCANCSRPVCRDMESVRILLLLREGKRQEAGERLTRNLKLQPGEEYMLAIRRMVFETPCFAAE